MGRGTLQEFTGQLQEEGKKVRSEADVVRFLIWAEAVEELLPEAFI